MEAGIRSILGEFALWGDPHGDLPEKPSVLVQDFGLADPSDLWLFEASHLASAGRSLAQVHLDSLWIGNDMPISKAPAQMARYTTSCATQLALARFFW